MRAETEINAGYIPPSEDAAPNEAAVALAQWGAWLTAPRRDVERLLLIPAVLVAGVVLLASLELRLVVRRRRPLPPLHLAASQRVEPFVTQYPLHLYPILAKAFETAHLEAHLPPELVREGRVLELAIGEGSLSSQVFPPDADVTGLDISPYSLRHAAGKPHVRRAVVADCLDPPVRPGAFELLVANNFLHHVSDKDGTLDAWAPLGRVAVFNESTPYWASGWVKPYLLARLGLRRRAAAAIRRVSLAHLQSLEPIESIDRAVEARWHVRTRQTFLSERTFFRCAVFSALLRCSGPPTPARPKAAFLGSLRFVALPLTRRLEKTLIAYEAAQSRDRDAYVSYVVESKSWSADRSGSDLVCVRCDGEVGADGTCATCGHTYATLDGMLFLLTEDTSHIEQTYSPALADTVPAEHL